MKPEIERPKTASVGTTSETLRRKPLILYVEDDDEWADLVHDWFACGSFSLQRVASRQDMLRFLETCQRLPACILMDLGLEDADGLQVCNEIKANPRWQRIPILIFTAKEDQRLAGLKHQALNVIAKHTYPIQ